MIEITDNNLSFLSDKKCFLLFYFTAKWCKPCQSIKPLLEKLSEGSDNNKLEIYMIDIDENDKLANEFKIRSVPTFFMYHEKQLKGECSGADINKVHKLIKDTMNKINKPNLI
jgi:thiol-disulfide isomerase/thioredoxin